MWLAVARGRLTRPRAAKRAAIWNLADGPTPLLVRKETAVARDDEFAEFVAARYRALVRTGLLMTGDTGHAEDLAQSALIRTYLAWGRLRDPANAEAYARRTLVRLSLRAKQRRWTTEFAAGRNPGDGASAASPSWPGPDDLAVDVRRALGALPSGQRAVLVLRFLDDHSEAETAELLNIPLGTVKSRAARGLASLRQAGLLDLEEGRHDR
jgi:RNA polymerase sigma-70 factor (sigma-E family)